MSDFEKVMKGLECCQYTRLNMCPQCPYQDEEAAEEDGYECTSQLARDALEIMTLLVPVLIDLDWLYEYPEGQMVWLETRKTLRPAYTIHHTEFPAWVCKNEIDRHEYILMTQGNLSKPWRFNLYNKTWRLWTQKPTEEQRKNAEWK